MTNAVGESVNCGAKQSASEGSISAVAATIANNRVNECIEKNARMGYQVDLPRRTINAALYPAAGPIYDAGQRAGIRGVIVAQGTKGKFGFVRPDGVTCEGSFTTLQGRAPDAMIIRYRDVIGISLSTDGMVPGLAVGSCQNGASFQAEYYVVYNTDTGFGVASDSEGNVYKVMAQ